MEEDSERLTCRPIKQILFLLHKYNTLWFQFTYDRTHWTRADLENIAWSLFLVRILGLNFGECKYRVILPFINSFWLLLMVHWYENTFTSTLPTNKKKLKVPAYLNIVTDSEPQFMNT